MLLVLATKKGVPVGSSNIEELEEGLREISEAQAIGRRGDDYWEIIRETLIRNSSTEVVEDAVREWVSDGDPYEDRGHCELCGKTPIKFHFPIRNKVNGNRLVVGSECIHHYLKIAGYETPQALKAKLTAQLNLLKKKERGGAGEEDYNALNEAFAVEEELRTVLGRMVGTEDLDLLEYRSSLTEVVTVCNQLGVSNASTQAAQKALVAIGPLRKVMEEGRRAQKFEGYGVGTLLTTLLRKRDPGEKLQVLKRVQDSLEAVLQYGPPPEVIARSWGAVTNCRDKLVVEATRKCDRGKAQVMEDYRDELEITKPYSFLHAMIDSGVGAQRKMFDEQLEKIKRAVESENFVEEIQKESSELASLLGMTFSPDLSNIQGPAGRIAFQVCDFVNAVARGRLAPVFVAIEGAYRLEGPIRDLAGVKASLLQAADEGIVEADLIGDDAIGKFVQEIKDRNPRVLELLQKEVDEVALLARETGTLQVYEVMGRQLGFDVEKAFKAYSTDNNPKFDEERFCRDIFERWASGRLTQLSPGQMTNIQRQLSFKGNREVRNSVWSALKAELTAKYSPIR
jgi:hypothetical protein